MPGETSRSSFQQKNGRILMRKDSRISDGIPSCLSAYGEVNWCEALGTVLANDEVVNGVSESGGYPE